MALIGHPSPDGGSTGTTALTGACRNRLPAHLPASMRRRRLCAASLHTLAMSSPLQGGEEMCLWIAAETQAAREVCIASFVASTQTLMKWKWKMQAASLQPRGHPAAAHL